MKILLLPVCFYAITSLDTAQVLDQQPSQQLSLYSHTGVGTNAENFVVTGSNASINTVKIWGTWDTSGAPSPDKFTLNFLSNRPSTPDDIPNVALHTFVGVLPDVVATGQLCPAFGFMLTEYELTFTLPSTVTLAPGTYWFEAFSEGTAGSTEQFAWEFANVDPINGLPCMAWSGQTPGSNWNVCTNFFFADDLSLYLGFEGAGTPICSPAENNSTGFPAVMTGSMGSGVGSGLHLECTGGVPTEFGYFLIGTAANDPGLVISQGRLCLDTTGTNQLGRYNVGVGVQNSIGQFDAAGTLQNLAGTATSSGGTGFDVPTAIPSIGGTIQVGQTWVFQVWYRDNGGFSNFSNALETTF